MNQRLSHQSVGIAVVGLGRIGRVHAKNLAEAVRSAHLVRVMDESEAVARACGRTFGVAASSSWKDVVGDPRVEAVVIATPVPTHARLVSLAAAAGKHAFCEKPLAVDVGEARSAVAAASDSGIRLQVGLQLRSDPDIAMARDRIESGQLGTVRFFRASLRDMEPPSPEYLVQSGGLFVDAAVHTLDLARWIVGEVTAVTAVGASAPDAPAGDVDTAVLALRFASGAVGVLEHSRLAGYGFECRVEVVGSRATVRVSHHRRTHLQWLTPGAVTVDHTASFVERFADAYVLELESFALAARTGGPVRASGEDALAALLLADAARRSAFAGRTVDPRQVA